MRIGALRDEAAALLDGILQNPAGAFNDEAAATLRQPSSPQSVGDGGCGGSCASTPRGDAIDGASSGAGGNASGAEEAIEVATTLGVDTGPAEEKLASVRRMLSVRILWGHLARFCLLPMRVTYKELVRQVAARYGAPTGTTMQLSWFEFGERYVLQGQASWEECLQRRGLMEKPGRIELSVQGQPPRRGCTPVPAVVKPRSSGGRSSPPAREPRAVTAHLPAPPPPTPDHLLVTGTPAYRGAASMKLLPPAIAEGPGAVGLPSRTSRTVRRPGPGRGGGRHGPTYPAGKAWAMATGREQPVHWAPAAGVVTSASWRTAAAGIGESSPSSGPSSGLCLEGRPVQQMRH